jgi:hypothetical protein
MKLRISFIVLLAITSCFFFTNRTSADVKQQSPKGITLSPALVQATVQSTESEHQIVFQITNNEQAQQNIKISTADFNTLDESGGLVFVGTNPTHLQKKYGLAEWITLSNSSLSLEPGQTAKISATITNQSTLSPGGHYGALMLTLDDSSQSASQNKVAVHPIATSLLFVNKVGGDTHRLKLTNVNSNHNIFKLPQDITLRFYNDGNTHLIPRGTIEITDPRGKLVAKGVINENSNLLLPETYRKFSVPIKRISNSVFPGKYKIVTNFRFDGYDQIRTYRTSQFLLTPLLLLFVLSLVLIAIIVVLFLTKNLFHWAQIFTPKKPVKKRK